MKKSRFSEEQIIQVIAGGGIDELCRKHGISIEDERKTRISNLGWT
jgi:hypothetical protein